MRMLAADLPLVLRDISVVAREVAILDRVSLELMPGAPTVLIGPNGAGKTTLLRIAMGLIEPTGGQVTWGGRSAVPPTRRAIVFQRPVMLRRTAAANVEYALAVAGVSRGLWPGRIEDLFNIVGLSGLGSRPARRLSGGEQQKLALARALARDPEVLFLDEPTASLDPAATKAIEDVVRAVAARGIKVVMATHDLGEARRLAGEIVLMHRGRVIESAPAAKFFAGPETDEGRRFIGGELLI
ncbi:MAG: tungstate transport system ATP-binding protein [Alphaproteobacteria bacterium]|jgi:tungstate transport system ATP-binding protein|nr:tungstate transport system ATP-binding protein [Alphaproteobacteria bacterium]MEA3026915.1 tungstate transport system ATP-binding protein [Alphaproteobacteria bacterium]